MEPDRVLRYLTEEGYAALMEFVDTAFARQLVASGALVENTLVTDDSAPLADAPCVDQHRRFSRVVSHPRLPFVSYPSEWGPRQLFDAASLTLELAEKALEHGFILKDATPYNLVFRGSAPVFVDVPSFAQRGTEVSAWPAGGQFSRMFLLPLLAHKLRLPNVRGAFLTHRDGMQASELAELPFLTKYFRRGYMSMVAVPTLLSRMSKTVSTEPRWEPKAGSEEKALYTLRWILASFRRQLRAVEPRQARATHWADYQRRVPSYSESEFAEKSRFVTAVLHEIKPRNVLDVGCNEGLFSKEAAKAGAAVVAFDQDAGVIDALYKEARDSGRNIHPLVIDLGRPTPSIGWRNHENLSFLDRARGSFDFVLALAVLHHLLVTEGVPLVDALRLFAELTSRYVLLEFIDPKDALFQSLLHGRENIHSYLSREHFEQVASEHFEIVQRCEVKSGLRFVYLLARR